MRYEGRLRTLEIKVSARGFYGFFVAQEEHIL